VLLEVLLQGVQDFQTTTLRSWLHPPLHLCVGEVHEEACLPEAEAEAVDLISLKAIGNAKRVET